MLTRWIFEASTGLAVVVRAEGSRTIVRLKAENMAVRIWAEGSDHSPRSRLLAGIWRAAVAVVGDSRYGRCTATNETVRVLGS